MPVIKSAIKKLKVDRKREVENDAWRKNVRDAVRKAKKSASAKTLEEAFSAIDKAVKHNIFHKNKAARLKSQLSKLVPAGSSSPKSTKRAPVKKSPSKTSPKVVKASS